MMLEKLKIGRNDPCPCGTRTKDGAPKKYKKCCIKQASPLPQELIRKMNKQLLDSTRKEHEEFLEAHVRSTCYLCSLPYDQFDPTKPCSHWLLRPAGIKKDILASVLEEKGCFVPQALIRWIANAESLIGTQINDFVDEDDPSKIFETTIRYKHYEWSFSCSASDFAGHKDSSLGRKPHFHFQMRINGRPFIDYGDYHFDFTPYDMDCLDIKQKKVPGMEYIETFGAGINDVIKEVMRADLQGMKIAPDEASAQLHAETILEAAPGASILGDELADLMQESKLAGIPMANLLRRLKNVSIETVIEPGPLVSEKAPRTPRKRNRNTNDTFK